MKKNIIILIGAVLAAVVVMGFKPLGTKPATAIVKNEIVLHQEKGKYMQVRHIVLKGSNEEIGRALGEIALQDYKARLIKYASPIYAKARIAYMSTNYPILLERMKGVAKAFELDLNNTDYDTSNLYYCEASPQCAAIFFPMSVSRNGHNFYTCNRDYYLASMSQVMGGKLKFGEPDMLERMIVLEMYPDKGYPSLGIGALDLMNMQIDIVNSQGLSIVSLEDDTFGMERTFKDLSRASGLHLYQATRLIADTCSTLDEAKEALLNNKISLSLMPAHFMVMDTSGNSFIYEKSKDNFADIIIDSKKGEPVVITNHSIYEYPTVNKFPESAKDDYDTFNRYRRLDKFVKGHKGKFSIADGEEAMSLAYGRVDEASEGGHHDLPLRTLYTAAVDLDEHSISVKFYQRDKMSDRPDGLTDLVFSNLLTFKLQKVEKVDK